MNEAWLKRIAELKTKGGVDLSTDEDLSLAVMNLISLEEHFFFTGAKTHQDQYFDTAEEIRTLRKELLAKLMPAHEGETWCISKHLLATTMRLVEVGNKLQTNGRQGEAKAMFERAYRVYSLFWALKLKLIKGDQTASTDQPWKLEDLVTKLADCCKE